MRLQSGVIMADDLDAYAGNIMVDEYSFSLVEFLAEKNRCRVEDVFKVALCACMFMAKAEDSGEDIELFAGHGGNFYPISLWDVGQKYMREGRDGMQ